MQPLYTEQELQSATSRQPLPLKCLHCNKTFYRDKNDILSTLAGVNGFRSLFCSRHCIGKHKTTSITVICLRCHKSFTKLLNQVKKYPNHFCSSSCAAKYNNTHKTKGTRISKLEVWISTKLPPLYPNLEFHFNRKDAINGELDIYIPSLKLAFELNGIFHYEPIYGPEKLASIQNNDNRKAQACLEHNIELCLIDVSHLSYFKEQKAMKFLTIVQNIINTRLSGSSLVN